VAQPCVLGRRGSRTRSGPGCARGHSAGRPCPTRDVSSLGVEDGSDPLGSGVLLFAEDVRIR
jgi:hypothetical protein